LLNTIESTLLNKMSVRIIIATYRIFIAFVILVGIVCQPSTFPNKYNWNFIIKTPTNLNW